jgi:hypothetical protein
MQSSIDICNLRASVLGGALLETNMAGMFPSAHLIPVYTLAWENQFLMFD